MRLKLGESRSFEKSGLLRVTAHELSKGLKRQESRETRWREEAMRLRKQRDELLEKMAVKRKVKNTMEMNLDPYREERA